MFTGVIFTEVSGRVSAGQQGRALGWVMSGQSLTLLVGVPVAAWVGSSIGWRGVNICIAALAAASALSLFERAGTGTIKRVPRLRRSANSCPRRQRKLSMRWMIGSFGMAFAIERRAGGCRRQTLAASARLNSTTGMAPNRLCAATASDPHLIPPTLAAWLSVFRACFIAPVWNRVLVLVAGAVLAHGKRTVTQALRVMGLSEAPQFRRYHEVLGRARWDARAGPFARALRFSGLSSQIRIG